jgi:hypothetical protein
MNSCAPERQAVTASRVAPKIGFGNLCLREETLTLIHHVSAET